MSHLSSHDNSASHGTPKASMFEIGNAGATESFRKPGLPASASINHRKRRFDQLSSSTTQLSRDTPISSAVLAYLAQHTAGTPCFAKRRKMYQSTDRECCQICDTMLKRVISAEQPSPVITFQLSQLQWRSSSCCMCVLLLRALQGSDEAVSRQETVYNNSEENPFDPRDDREITDVESYTSKYSRMKIVLNVSAKDRHNLMGDMFSVLVLRFSIINKTQAPSRSSSESVTVRQLYIFTLRGEFDI